MGSLPRVSPLFASPSDRYSAPVLDDYVESYCGFRGLVAAGSRPNWSRRHAKLPITNRWREQSPSYDG